MKKSFSSHLGLVTYLLKEIVTAAEFVGSNNISNDFLIDGMKINDWFVAWQDKSPYYVCIRKLGTETGMYDDVKSRCSSLGEPIKVYVITKCGCGEFDVEVKNSL